METPASNNPEEKPVAMFALGLRAYQQPDGQIVFLLDSKNQGIPIEIVLMQIEAWLRNMKDEYFDNFDKTLTKK